MRDKVDESGVPDTVRRAASDVGSDALGPEGLDGEREARIRRHVDDYPSVSTAGKGAVVFRWVLQDLRRDRDLGPSCTRVGVDRGRDASLGRGDPGRREALGTGGETGSSHLRV